MKLVKNVVIFLNFRNLNCFLIFTALLNKGNQNLNFLSTTDTNTKLFVSSVLNELDSPADTCSRFSFASFPTDAETASCF